MLIQIESIDQSRVFFTQLSRTVNKPENFDRYIRGLWMPKPINDIYKFDTDNVRRNIPARTLFTIGLISLKTTLNNLFTRNNRKYNNIDVVMITGGTAKDLNLRMDFYYGGLVLQQFALFKLKILPNIPTTSRHGFLTRKTAIIPLPFPKDL